MATSMGAGPVLVDMDPSTERWRHTCIDLHERRGAMGEPRAGHILVKFSLSSFTSMHNDKL